MHQPNFLFKHLFIRFRDFYFSLFVRKIHACIAGSVPFVFGVCLDGGVALSRRVYMSVSQSVSQHRYGMYACMDAQGRAGSSTSHDASDKGSYARAHGVFLAAVTATRVLHIRQHNTVIGITDGTRNQRNRMELGLGAVRT
jgi:hypothetical protein